MCVVKIEDGKQELSGLQIGGWVIAPWRFLNIYFIQLYNTFESSLQIHMELENPFAVPQYS